MTTQAAPRMAAWRRWRIAERPVSPTFMLLMACAWMATAGNAALWKQLSALGVLSGAPGWLLAAGLAGFVMGMLTLLGALLGWRWTLKPFLILLLVVSAGSTHFSLSFGTIMDPSMMTNVLQTDAGESADLLSATMLLHLALLAGLPIVWIVTQPVVHGTPSKAVRRNAKLVLGGFLVAILSVLVCFQPLASTMRNHKQVRYLINPLNVVYSLGSVLFSGPARSGQVQPIGQDAVIAKRFEGLRPPLLVLVA